MKFNKLISFVLVAFSVIMLSACSSSSTPIEEEVSANTYTINEGENRDVPANAQIVSISSEDAQVKLTRDIEGETTNVYVISGTVEVTEAEAEE